MPATASHSAPHANTHLWHRADLVVPDEVAEILCAECFELGSCGLQDQVAGPGHTRLTVFFEDDLQPDTIREALATAVERAGTVRVEIQMSTEPVADWNAEWRKFYRPVWATERIVVHPPWIPVEVEAGQMSIVIDPAMAFGTGGHESTQAALAGLEDTVLEGSQALDVGIGSGVLAIAACRLGVAHLVGVDIDPVAVENARLNLRMNLGEEAASNVDLRLGSAADAGDGPFDVIVANIESHILLPMLGDLISRVARGGSIIFSGLLRREEDHFVAGLVEAGLTLDGRWQRDDWFSCRARLVE
ncbi:MAG: 50S ribosomal protein L11 methyltransferase [Gemmatimonadetes bacterium]|nr:50S ribosomal protein L11 methyltransferase [Gemmatimonadota bacterium]MBT7859671.1 50S ribosomal protein L11 methyltransferase [Gemmatimonadota bacterium]